MDVSIRTLTETATSVQSTMANATSSPSSATAMLSSVTGVSITVLAVVSPPTVSEAIETHAVTVDQMSLESSLIIAACVALSVAAFISLYHCFQIKRMRAAIEPAVARPGSRDIELWLRGDFQSFKEDPTAQNMLLEKLARINGRYDAAGNLVGGIDPRRLRIVKLKAGSIIVTVRIAEVPRAVEKAAAATKAAQIAESKAAMQLKLGAATKAKAMGSKLKARAEAAALLRATEARVAAEKAAAEMQAAFAAAAELRKQALIKAQVAAVVKQVKATHKLRATEAQMAADRAAKIAESAAAMRLELGASTRVKPFGSKFMPRADTASIAATVIAAALEAAFEEMVEPAAYTTADTASIAITVTAKAVEAAVENVLEAAAEAAA